MKAKLIENATYDGIDKNGYRIMGGEGLLIIEIRNKFYCANCGMPCLNNPEWKSIHSAWHKLTAEKW